MSTPTRLPDVVIGGTEKAGTTSVFDWLAAHPQVAVSARKETDFFRNGWTGSPGHDASAYAAHFAHCDPHVPVWLEASPGYLGEATRVAPRMAALLPEVKLLFLLRDPVDRLYSSFQFHRGRLDLPTSLGFDDYVQRCLDYEGGATPAALGLDEWYLRVLGFGRYAGHLATFRRCLPRASIEVAFFEDLRTDERTFMTRLSGFLGIEPGFWHDFDFRPSNVTFSARHRALHRVAVQGSRLAEPIMRRYPAVKRSLVRAYKSFNQQRQGYDPMPTRTRARLVQYYADSVRELAESIAEPLPPQWHYLLQARAAA